MADIDLSGAYETAERAAQPAYDRWRRTPNRDAYAHDMARRAARGAVAALAPALIREGRRQVLDEILSHDDGGHDWSIPDVVLLARGGEEAVDRANGGGRG